MRLDRNDLPAAHNGRTTFEFFKADIDARIAQTVQRLLQTIGAKKIFYVADLAARKFHKRQIRALAITENAALDQAQKVDFAFCQAPLNHRASFVERNRMA